MAHQCAATVGSAALDVVEDPALADEVGVTSGGRVANLRGQSSPQDSYDKRPQDALTAEDMSPMQHAALQGCTPQAVHEAVHEEDDDFDSRTRNNN